VSAHQVQVALAIQVTGIPTELTEITRLPLLRVASAEVALRETTYVFTTDELDLQTAIDLLELLRELSR